MQLYGITGHPLGHSLSPVLHNWALQQAGITGAYLAWPLPAGRMPDLVNAVRTLHIQGVSVTIPHKEAVMPLVDSLTARARALGAVNTLYWDQDVLCGDNTDVEGFVTPLRGRVFTGALVLGAGGAARAALAGLRELNLPAVAVCNHNRERAQKLADEFEVRCVDWEERGAYEADLLINATPLGMRGTHEGRNPLPPEAFTRGHVNTRLVYDLIYTPLTTRFLAEAEAAGWQTQEGLAMFIAQAQAQFRLWTGREFSEAEARTLLLRELGRRG
ncbi:MAG: shikimate dehydrogenase [Deltaproteobacteria bacterium]|jgi:shikimate dehydrogenase|nr:shikimate dehydrogenase [Deltaproteobacteria bacterium]